MIESEVMVLLGFEWEQQVVLVKEYQVVILGNHKPIICYKYAAYDRPVNFQSMLHILGQIIYI